MLEHELAQRLVNYADAIVAFAFVGVSAFGIAVADPDIRCGLATARPPTIVAAIITGAVFTIVLLLLRKGELDLRCEERLSVKALRYSTHLNTARFVLVWLSITATILLVTAISPAGCDIPALS